VQFVDVAVARRAVNRLVLPRFIAEEQFDDFVALVLLRKHQGCFAGRLSEPEAGIPFKQQFRYLLVAFRGCHMKSRLP